MKIVNYSLLFLTTILLPLTALAVDGYKEFKFGTNMNDVHQLAKIPLTQQDMGDGVILLSGEGFLFANSTVEIGFYFIKDKLLRIAFEIPIDKIQGIIVSLKEKYGVPSSASKQAEFSAVDQFPSREAFVAFDKDTVIVKMMSDESGVQSAFIIYTSLKYDQVLLENQKKSVTSDL